VLPKDLLARVTATPTTGTVNGMHVVDASRTFGRTIREVVTVLGILLLLALILLWLYRRFIQLPTLVGVFVVDKAVDADRAVIPLEGGHGGFLLCGGHTETNCPGDLYARTRIPASAGKNCVTAAVGTRRSEESITSTSTLSPARPSITTRPTPSGAIRSTWKKTG